MASTKEFIAVGIADCNTETCNIKPLNPTDDNMTYNIIGDSISLVNDMKTVSDRYDLKSLKLIVKPNDNIINGIAELPRYSNELVKT